MHQLGEIELQAINEILISSRASRVCCDSSDAEETAKATSNNRRRLEELVQPEQQQQRDGAGSPLKSEETAGE